MKAWHILLVLVCLVASFIAGYHIRGDIGRAEITQSDTVIIVDTIRDTIPVPVKEKPIGFIPAPDAIVKHDTIHETDTVYVPTIQKEYSTPDYHAWVSGYNAALDSITVFPKTVYVTKKVPDRRWGLGLIGGYGIGMKGLSPYVGIGVYYRIW